MWPLLALKDACTNQHTYNNKPAFSMFFHLKYIAGLRVKDALSTSAIKPAHYSGHSFRTGAATTAARKGLQVSQIKQLGRWKSNAFLRYLKPSADYLSYFSRMISSSKVDEN